MNVKTAIKKIIKQLFPEACAGCNIRLSHENLLCTDCMYDLPITDHHKMANNRFTNHFLGRVNIEKGAAYLHFRKEGSVQELMHKFKYGGKFFIGVFLGNMAAELVEKVDYFKDIDIIVPVPLHKVKKSIRGYNQCEAFAQGLSEYSNIPCSVDILLKIKNTSSQTKKSRIQRIENVEKSFLVTTKVDLNNKHILIVDDVVTTGATLEACALALMKVYPGVKISMYTIAIANS
ncbi:MAG: ComF family protein [Saprospiraceae bacterium]